MFGLIDEEAKAIGEIIAGLIEMRVDVTRTNSAKTALRALAKDVRSKLPSILGWEASRGVKRLAKQKTQRTDK